MNAVILAGGYGNRLKPLTNSMPKPMLRVGNRPMIDYSISQLYHFGVEDIVLTLAFMPETIIHWSRGYAGLSFHYNVESNPLGTLGGIKEAARFLDDQFFVLSGDGISDIDLEKMKKQHEQSGADITMAVTSVRNPSLYGVAALDKDGMITEYIEKPQNDYKGNYINCGCYIVNKYVLDQVPNGFYDFSKNLFPDMLQKQQRIAAYIHSGYWSDVGDLPSYYVSNFNRSLATFYKPVRHTFRDKSYFTGSKGQSVISEQAKVVGQIHDCVIGKESFIASGAVLEHCIVLEQSVVKGRHRDCILCKDYAIDIKEYIFDGHAAPARHMYEGL